MFETNVAKRRAQRGDEMVELPIMIVEQRLVRAIGQFFLIAFRCVSQSSEVAHALMENPDHGSAAVIAACEDGRSQPHEPPHEFQRFPGIGVRDMIDDCASLCFEIFHKCAPVLPIDECARTRYCAQSLADFARSLGGALRAGERKPQPTFDGCVAVADLDQKFGEPLGAERFEILGVERDFWCHGDVLTVGF